MRSPMSTRRFRKASAGAFFGAGAAESGKKRIFVVAKAPGRSGGGIKRESGANPEQYLLL